MLFRTMKQLNKVYLDKGKVPYDINNGLCDEWAYEVYQLLSGKVVVEIWETVWGYTHTSHIFIRVKEKFYDAECLEGVRDHMNLPIFKKLKAGRQSVWLTDINCETHNPKENKRDITDEQVREYDKDNGTSNANLSQL